VSTLENFHGMPQTGWKLDSGCDVIHWSSWKCFNL